MSTEAALPAPVMRNDKRDTLVDLLFRSLVSSAGIFVLLALVGAAVSMLWGGRLAFETFGWQFLTTEEWDVPASKFGALVPIYGTLVTAGIAMLIAVPVSFGIAVFLPEVAPPWLRGPVSAALDLPALCSWT